MKIFFGQLNIRGLTIVELESKRALWSTKGSVTLDFHVFSSKIEYDLRTEGDFSHRKICFPESCWQFYILHIRWQLEVSIVTFSDNTQGDQTNDNITNGQTGVRTYHESIVLMYHAGRNKFRQQMTLLQNY